tara:strand:- start:3417 stop:3959 length:543 start_codon:yes stop_codon:yes gene_type:complete
MQSEAFPDFAVRQAFREVDVERDDDLIIPSIQNSLVTACTTIVLKGAVGSCVCAKRKYINDRDIEYALATSLFPTSQKLSTDTGYLLNTRQLGNMCNEHLNMLSQLYKKQNVDAGEIKMSQETLLVLQNAIERLVRGFFEYFAESGRDRTYTYRLFEECLNQLLGQPQNEELPFVLVARS